MVEGVDVNRQAVEDAGIAQSFPLFISLCGNIEYLANKGHLIPLRSRGNGVGEYPPVGLDSWDTMPDVVVLAIESVAECLVQSVSSAKG